MAEQAIALESEFEGFRQREDVVLNRRYKIIVDAPLPAFDTPTACAFRVADLEIRKTVTTSGHSLFARINTTGLPSRNQEIDILLNLHHPNLMRLVDSGVTEFDGPDTACLTVVLVYPQGGRLMSPETAAPMPLRKVMLKVISPLCDVLSSLHAQNVFHRAIHPDNLFAEDDAGEVVILGDCVSSVAGQNLPAAFQPLERACAAPLGCGAGNSAADIFSFGVTIAALLAGRIPGAEHDPDALLLTRLEKGSHAALCGSFHFPREVDWLLVGMLADDPDKRWKLDKVQDWLSGRLVALPALRYRGKSEKTFIFAERKYLTPPAVAEAFNRDWDLALSAIQSGQLEHWLSSHRYFINASESVFVLRKSHAAGSAKISNDVLVSRVCMVLDPKGPIRLKGLAVSIDAIGVVLAFAYIEQRQDIADKIAFILDQGLANYWIAAISERRNEMSREATKFIRLGQYIRNPRLGNGIERCLYDLNPSLACLHGEIHPADRGDATALLTSLEKHFPTGNHGPPWTDRHVAAYLAAQMYPRSDSLLASVTMPNSPQAMETMIGMTLVALAQKKLNVPLLPGLTSAAGSRLYEILDSYHSESRRQTLRAELKQLLSKGDFNKLLLLLDDTELREQDRRKFYDAQSRYKKLGGEILQLTNGLSQHNTVAALLGRKYAAWTAFLGFFVVSYMILMGIAL